MEYEARERPIYEFNEKRIYVPTGEIETIFFINKLCNNSNVTLRMESEEDVEQLRVFLSQEPKIFNDYVGIHFDNTIEVMLAPVSRVYRLRPLENNELKIEIFYKGLEYKISIGKISNKSLLQYFIENAIEVRRRGGFYVHIEKTCGSSIDLNEQEVRELLFSVLFDIEYSYDISLDTVKYHNSNYSRFIKRSNRQVLPTEPIRLIYKDYIPELIEYLHIADKVDYLPFKFICYFHIIEYFMDKSAYRVAAKKVKELMLKPDFHIKTNDYVSDAINIFKKENDRYQTDANKINRVLNEFIEQKDIATFISEIELNKHFENDLQFESGKTFILPKIKFDSEKEFFTSLSKRIYSLRCSIVHSNPDFNENKAIPFTPNEHNLSLLRQEIELIKEVSKTIVSKSID